MAEIISKITKETKFTLMRGENIWKKNVDTYLIIRKISSEQIKEVSMNDRKVKNVNKGNIIMLDKIEN